MKHGHRNPRTPTYRSWDCMIQRCTNWRNKDWDLYGARGIKVCDRWRSFANFLEDVGVRPEGTTLDRIDVNGHYEPGNCRWATPLQQVHNRRPNGEAKERAA